MILIKTKQKSLLTVGNIGIVKKKFVKNVKPIFLIMEKNVG